MIHIRKKGFTLIEVLVVISVIGILSVLLVSAVLASRETARRSLCANNLRQMGIAFSAYVSNYGVIPMSHSGMGYSPQFVLTPYMDLVSIYNSANMSIAVRNEVTPELLTVQHTQVAGLICPSGTSNDFGPGITCYAGNRGVGFNSQGHLNNGIFNQPVRSSSITLSDVTDGVSNTVLFSEWLPGPSVNSQASGASIIFQLNKFDSSEEYPRFIDSCTNATVRASDSTTGKGLNWVHGDLRSSLYNHAMGINKNTCQNAGRVQKGAWTANSNHKNGINSVFADGHAQFIRDSVSLPIWRAISTRSGGEVTQEP